MAPSALATLYSACFAAGSSGRGKRSVAPWERDRIPAAWEGPGRWREAAARGTGVSWSASSSAAAAGAALAAGLASSCPGAGMLTRFARLALLRVDSSQLACPTCDSWLLLCSPSLSRCGLLVSVSAPPGVAGSSGGGGATGALLRLSSCGLGSLSGACAQHVPGTGCCKTSTWKLLTSGGICCERSHRSSSSSESCCLPFFFGAASGRL